MRRQFVLFALFTLVACPSDKSTEPASTPTATGTPPAPAVAPDTPREPAPPPAVASRDLWVTGVVVVRKIASDDKKIDDPERKIQGKKVNNFVTVLYRGESVTAVGAAEDWLEIELLGGQTGYAKEAGFIDHEALKPGVVLHETRLFKRPDISALASKMLSDGSLVFVGKSSGDFSQVNYPTSVFGARQAWVQTKDLEYADDEFTVAQLLNKARYLVAKSDEHGYALTALAREHFGDTHLATLMPDAPEPTEEAAPDTTPEGGTE